MKPNSSSVFLRLVIFLVLLAFCSTKGYSQTSEELDFKYKVVTEKTGNELKYSVTITVTKGSGPFSYELCDKALALGGKSLDKSELTTNKTFVFTGLTSMEYYVYVYLPNQQLGKGKKIQIK